MKFLIILTLFACVILSVLTISLKWHHFDGAAKTCSNWKIAGNKLTGYCKNTLYHAQDETIDIDTCIGNNNGSFADGTNASKTCSNLHIEGNLLKGSCKNAQGQDHQAQVDLNIIFANIHGALKCR